MSASYHNRLERWRALITASVVFTIACRHPQPRHADTASTWQLACPRPVHLTAFTADSVPATEDLMLPASLISDIERSSSDQIVFSIDVCGGEPPVIGDVKHSTHFPEADRILVERVPALSVHVQLGICTTLHLRVTGFFAACDWPHFSL